MTAELRNHGHLNEVIELYVIEVANPVLPAHFVLSELLI